MSPGLPPAALGPGLAVIGRWALSPRIGWVAMRRRADQCGRFPGPPRGTVIASQVVGGVRCEELRPLSCADDARLLYFHGGGYVVGSPRSHRSLIGRLAAGFGAPALAVDYRLAPEHPHPAALDDARAVWAALTESGGAAGTGVGAERIAVAGDSAGAGLALALALSLREAGRPLPAAIGLISPWLDLAADVAGVRARAPRDVLLNRGLLRAFAGAYLSGGASPRDSLVSPVYANLAGLPPLVVHTTDDELIRADGRALAQRARAAGVPVSCEELPNLWHDAHMTAALLAEPGGGAPLRIAGALRAHVPAR
ncbi:MAG: alpha/beta hydrolase fold domain-containing protein [Solirubrobacteraceae bacterium]